MHTTTWLLHAILCGCLLIVPLGGVNSAVYTQANANTNTNTNNTTNNPALTMLAQDMLDNSPRIQAARAAVKAVRAREQAANQALYNPELELDSEKTGIRTSSVQLSQTIDMGGQRESRTSVAQAELTQAIAEFELASHGITRDLLNTLADNRTRQELAQLAQRALKLMQNLSNIAERRHKAGDLNQVELNHARLALGEAQVNHAQALALMAAVQENLRALLGTLPANLPDLPESLPVATLPDDHELFIQNLPAIRAQQAQVRVARHMVDLRRSERSWDPSIALRAGKEDKDSLVGITLTVPLNIRNTFRAEVEAAGQDLLQQEQLAQQVYRDQRATVLASTKRFQLLQQAWRNWRQSGQVSVDNQLQLIERLWRASDMSTTEYLVQLKQALDTQAAGLELREKLWQSGFDWMYHTAGILGWLNINLTEN